MVKKVIKIISQLIQVGPLSPQPKIKSKTMRKIDPRRNNPTNNPKAIPPITVANLKKNILTCMAIDLYVGKKSVGIPV